MEYRPEYHLDRLRMMIERKKQATTVSGNKCGTVEPSGGEPPQPLLHLRWLRTMVVDLQRCTALDEQQQQQERLELQHRSSVAVERVVCVAKRTVVLSRPQLSLMQTFLTQFVPRLHTLNFRGCDDKNAVCDAFLLAVADVHRSSLRRLYLPPYSNIAQSTLDHFTQLEELDVTGCPALTNVNFCSATLRVLHANNCTNLTDEGLRHAVRLEVLHVRSCRNVTDVSPFAHRLLLLDASGDKCGIGSATLSNCYCLQVLRASLNQTITTLLPFAQRLRELDVGLNQTVGDVALAEATGLIKLEAIDNTAIRTVRPFGPSLRELHAQGTRITEEGLVTATNLVHLSAPTNHRFHSLKPFSSTLLELDVDSNCIDDRALSSATKLIWLKVIFNKRITTVQSCGSSLRHLVGHGSGLTNDSLSSATQLVTLDCSGNPNLTTIKPFQHSLQEFYPPCEAAPSLVEEMGEAPNLHFIHGRLSDGCITHLTERNRFTGRQCVFSWYMYRNTVTYSVSTCTEV